MKKYIDFVVILFIAMLFVIITSVVVNNMLYKTDLVCVADERPNYYLCKTVE